MTSPTSGITPRNTEQTLLLTIADRLAEQNTLLGEIRDRLGQATDEAPPAEDVGPTPVELREPDPGPNPAADDNSAPRKRATRTKGSRS